MDVHTITRIIKETEKDNIILLAASKGRTAQQIKRIYELGVHHVGESYLQEAEKKVPSLKDLNINWHFIGHLQKNKVRKAIKLFDSIDSVDSLDLAEAINQQCKRLKKTISILVQVNISKERQKHGFDPHHVEQALSNISSLSNIVCAGFMCIGSKENSKEEFKKMKQLFDKHKEKYGMTILSMGMSGDFWEAIKQGATMVRLGTILFE